MKILESRTVSAVLLTALVGAPSLGAAGELRQLTEVSQGRQGTVATLDDAGTTVYINTSTTQFGDNPRTVWQIARFDAASGAGALLTGFADGVLEQPGSVSVSDDNQWLAFVSRGDLTGQNHDQSAELFVMKTDGTQLSQLSDDSSVVAGPVRRVVMSGNADRLVFLSRSNSTGTNPDGIEQVVAVRRDGTGWTQLTQAGGGAASSTAVSDDGLRVVFSHSADLTGGNADGNSELFAVNVDGTNLRQLTSTTAGGVETVAISGDGTKIAFEATADPVTGSNADHSYEIFAIDWSGGGLIQLTDSTGLFPGDLRDARYPSLTDDAAWVVYLSNDSDPFRQHHVFRIHPDGTGEAQIGTQVADSYPVAVAGGDGRIVFNGNAELYAMDGNGSGVTQLTSTPTSFVESSLPDVSGDASTIVFESRADLSGQNPDNGFQIFRVDRDGSNLTQLTQFAQFDSSTEPTTDQDGSHVVFISDTNLTGDNPDGSPEVFLMDRDGTGLVQLSSAATGYSGVPVLSNDGTRIAYTAVADTTGLNADGNPEIVCMNSDGTNVTQITSSSGAYPPNGSVYPRLDQTGNWVVFESGADLLGTNADGSWEIFRARCDGSGLQQITDDATFGSRWPDISADGSRIVFSSAADITGNNEDHNQEVFLYEPGSGTFTQLTDRTRGDAVWPRLSDDGEYVLICSAAPILETDLDPRGETFRLHIDTGVSDRMSGLGLGEVLASNRAPLNVSGDGSVAVFQAPGNFNDNNPDYGREIWAADLASPGSSIVVGQPSPTLLSWKPGPRPVRYDVIRGDVANLADTGTEVFLGTVICLEDDSPDADTAGSEDPVEPAAGQTFFFLYRGSQGLDDGSGSYGSGSSGLERVAGGGDCSP